MRESASEINIVKDVRFFALFQQLRPRGKPEQARKALPELLTALPMLRLCNRSAIFAQILRPFVGPVPV